MIWHEDERVQQEFSLAALVEDGLLKQFRSGSHLKKAAAFSRHGGHEIRTSFLWREPRVVSRDERPAAKATPPPRAWPPPNASAPKAVPVGPPRAASGSSNPASSIPSQFDKLNGVFQD